MTTCRSRPSRAPGGSFPAVARCPATPLQFGEPDMPEAQPRSPFPTPEVAAAETPGPQGIMTLAVAVVVLAALYFGREVFIPIVVAVLLAFVLAPFVDLLRRLRIGRIPSVIVA